MNLTLALLQAYLSQGRRSLVLEQHAGTGRNDRREGIHGTSLLATESGVEHLKNGCLKCKYQGISQISAE
jgi:hypothetical protein